MKHKVAIVTGGATGIGRGAALALGKAGATVIIAGRSADAGHATAAEVSALGGTGVYRSTDVTKAAECAALVAFAEAEFGRLDYAFNNAGGHRALNTIDGVEIDEADWVFDLNLKAMYYCLKYQTASMLKTGGGAIVNNASIFGTKAMPALAHYVAAKHGVVGLTRAVALDMAQKNIRVNAVAPGPIKTPAYDRVTGGDDHAYDDYVPMHHIGSPKDVAEAVVWLLSDAASYVTGTIIAVDGGMSAG